MKHLNANLDNITNVETDKTPVGAIRAIGVDSENDIVLTGSTSTDDGSGGGSDLDASDCVIYTTYDTDIHFQDNTGATYPKGANTADFIEANFHEDFFYELEITDVSSFPTLAAITVGTTQEAVTAGNLTIRGLDSTLGSVVFTYYSARKTGNTLVLGGKIRTVGDGVTRNYTYTALANASDATLGGIATYNDTGFGNSHFNSGTWALQASNFTRGRIAGIWITPNSTAERDQIASDWGVSVSNLRQNVSNRPIQVTFTRNAGNNFVLAVHQVIFTTAGNIYIVGRSPFQDIQTDQFISGAGTFSPSSGSWSMSYSIGTSSMVQDPLEFVTGEGSWAGPDAVLTSEEVQACIGGNARSLDMDSSGGISTDGDVNIGGQITQGALNGPVFANEAGTLDVGNIYANTVPVWDGTTIVNSGIEYTAGASQPLLNDNFSLFSAPAGLPADDRVRITDSSVGGVGLVNVAFPDSTRLEFTSQAVRDGLNVNIGTDYVIVYFDDDNYAVGLSGAGSGVSNFDLDMTAANATRVGMIQASNDGVQIFNLGAIEAPHVIGPAITTVTSELHPTGGIVGSPDAPTISIDAGTDTSGAVITFTINSGNAGDVMVGDTGSYVAQGSQIAAGTYPFTVEAINGTAMTINVDAGFGGGITQWLAQDIVLSRAGSGTTVTNSLTVTGALRGGTNTSPQITVPTVDASGAATSAANYNIVIVPTGTTIMTRLDNVIYLELE